MSRPLPMRAIVFSAAALFLCAPFPAHGQSAKRLLAKGNKLFAAGDYAAALQVFEKGNAKRESAAFLRNMAFCQLKLHKHTAAMALLEKYLAKYKKAKDAQKLADTVTKLKDVVSTKLNVTSTPPGATIFIDARAAGKRGVTPANDLTISPGTHTLILQREGFADTTRTFTIAARETKSLDVALEVDFKVVTTPPGAVVRIDDPTGKVLGKTPLTDGYSIPKGKHTIYLELAGFKTIKKDVDAQGPVSLQEVMKVGHRIMTSPSGATIQITSAAGVKVEGATPFDAELQPGSYTLTIALPGFKKVEKVFEVKPGMGPLSITLEGGLLTMRAENAKGATVTVGQLKIGTVPFDQASVPLGRHKVKASHPQHGTWTRTLDFKADKIVQVEAAMGRSRWPFWTGLAITAAGALTATVTGTKVLLDKHSDWNSYDIADYEANPNADPIIRCAGSLKDAKLKTGPCDYTLAKATDWIWGVTGVTAAITGYLFYHYFWRDADDVEYRNRGEAEPPPAAASASALPPAASLF